MAILLPETLLTLADLGTIFVAGYISVFTLGFQSRNVNHGNYGWAAITSAFVGISQATLWSHILAPGQTWAGAAMYAVAGACGITSSMYVHERFVKAKPSEKNPKRIGP